MSDGYARAERKRRIDRRVALRQRGIRPSRLRRVCVVTTDAIPIPEWAKKRALRGLGHDGENVWLRLSDGRKLMELDREAGGNPKMVETTMRRCGICKRLLLAEDAEMRAKLDDSAMTGRQKPCDDDCLAIAARKR